MDRPVAWSALHENGWMLQTPVFQSDRHEISGYAFKALSHTGHIVRYIGTEFFWINSVMLCTGHPRT